MEFNVLLRLPEMYLVRAEARAAKGKLSEAIADVNTVRERAGLHKIVASSPAQQIIRALKDENRHEYFTELGHRWFDIRRWQSNSGAGKRMADDVLTEIKPQYWASYKIHFPIPGMKYVMRRNLPKIQGINDDAGGGILTGLNK
ncbi:RagB/SusD family nutrient uptake outer membrane protein [Paraflavitalea speifideaquila]|uniref:RagB/SusD family nutrient uptake outer membrane protein n=1 Tax=Paraflavitalea speifideaquila TaxID=3076558 RepID=UPI0028EF10A1|nr:RagB/SusD family nutrient uptake outer membrane protein [Paraflavitalea speifideiaquila]